MARYTRFFATNVPSSSGDRDVGAFGSRTLLLFFIFFVIDLFILSACCFYHFIPRSLLSSDEVKSLKLVGDEE